MVIFIKKINFSIKSILLIIIATILSKTFGFFREVSVGSILGTSNVADAYIFAVSIPGIILAGISEALSTVFIPIYSKLRVKNENEELYFVNNLMNVIFTVSIALALICVVFAKQIISIAAMGFDEPTFEIAIKMSRIIFLSIGLMGVNGILQGYLQANSKFFIPAIVNVPNSIIIIISLLFYKYIGITGLSYAILIGMATQTVLLLAKSLFSGYKHRFVIQFNDKNIKNILILSLPVFLGSSVGQLNTLINRMVASGLPVGSIASLNYADKLYNFISGTVIFALSMVLYPVISERIAINDMAGFKNLILRSMNLITITLLPATVALLILNKPLVTFVFKRGSFDQNSTLLTSSALFYYAFGILFLGYREIIGKAFYSIQDTKTPTVNSIISIGVNIALNLILSKVMLHNGLALASSISAVVLTIALIYSLRKKIGALSLHIIFNNFGKCLISSTLMGIIIYIIYALLKYKFETGGFLIQSIILITVVIVGAITYLVSLVVLRNNELIWGLEIVKNKYNSFVKMRKAS